MPSLLSRCTLLGLTICLCVGPVRVWAGSRTRVQQALEELHVWLGDGENGNRWRQFLHSERLHELLQKGANCDAQEIAPILAIYAGQTPGLERARFVAVRQALESWRTELTSVDPLAQAALDAKRSLRPIDPQELVRSRTELQAAIEDMERYLARGTQDNANRWKRFLGWETLRRQLADSTPSVSRLEATLLNFRRNQKGLELSRFIRVRTALRRHIDALIYSDPTIQQAYHKLLDDLSQRLNSYAKDPRSDDPAVIGRALGILKAGRQAGGLVASIESRYWHPNVLVSVSEQFANAGITRPVDKTLPLTDNILGTSIRGTARTTGTVSLTFAPSHERALMDLHLDGQAVSDSVGTVRKYSICTDGVTTICATKRLELDPTGVRSSPSVASCRTSSTITGIGGARLRLVQKFIFKKALESQPQAEVEAARSAEKRVEQQFDEESEGLLSDANRTFQDNLRPPILVRLDAVPRSLHFHTTADDLRISVLETGRDQLGAPGAPPASPAGQDVCVQVHESAVMNVIEDAIGGLYLTDVRLVQLLQENELEVPEELKITDDKDPWSITFTDRHPVRIAFSDQTLTVGIRGRRFTRADQEVRSEIDISAVYKLEVTPSGAHFHRQGEVVVDFVNRRRLGVQQIAMKTFLQRKFNSVFKSEISTSGFQLPNRFERVGTLRLQQLQTAGGWLTAAWNRDSGLIRTAMVR